MPLALAFWISLTEWNVAGFKEFVGLQNYVDMLDDERWIEALKFTSWYTVMVTILTFTLGFGLALLVRSPLRRFVALRTAFYLPVVIGPATASFIFLYLFNDQVGAVNTGEASARLGRRDRHPRLPKESFIRSARSKGYGTISS